MKKLVVYLTYGKELKIYQRAREVWQFYRSFFPEIDIYFVRESTDHGMGEVFFDGYDLVIGISDKFTVPEGQGISLTGEWHPIEHQRTIYRQVAIYDFLLKQYADTDFYLYATTITSVVNFTGLLEFLKIAPEKDCFAGSIELFRLNIQGKDRVLRLCSGANTLLSKDLVERLRNTYKNSAHLTSFPNDVWQALVLNDIPRMIIPRFDFIYPNALEESNFSTVYSEIKNHGIFQFRVKTSIGHNTLRENIDPWIMIELMKNILSHDYDRQRFSDFYDKVLSNIIAPINNEYIAPLANNTYLFHQNNIVTSRYIGLRDTDYIPHRSTYL